SRCGPAARTATEGLSRQALRALPCDGAPRDAIMARPLVLDRGPGMRVLVVEDSDRLQRALVAGLKQRGFAVDAAGDGQVGLERALAGTYDAIVLDLWLPKRDGIDVL